MGNPGSRFVGTRHNVGFDVVEAVAASRHLSLKKPFLRLYEWTGSASVQGIVLARPLTYMNRSGTVMPSVLRRARADVGDLLVVCDNLDLPPGTVRLKRKGSARSHNGLASIMDILGTGDFMRLYVGIGHPEHGDSVVDHVLGCPPDHESELYREAVSLAAWAAEELMTESTDAVMNALNRRS